MNLNILGWMPLKDFQRHSLLVLGVHYLLLTQAGMVNPLNMNDMTKVNHQIELIYIPAFPIYLFLLVQVYRIRTRVQHRPLMVY